MSNANNSKKSLEDEPILGLLSLPIQEMDQEQLKEFILATRNLRTLNQGLHNKLEKEGGRRKSTTKKAPSGPKVNLSEYGDMAE